MRLVYVIRKRDRKQPVSDYLLLEEALYHWEAMGYEHPEYYIEVFEGPEIPLPDKPTEAMYLFLADDDSSDEYLEPIENFDITRFM
jgi:hypothetical protein